MKTEHGKHGDPRHHATDIAALKAENERLRGRLALLDPEENFALLSTLAEAVENLNGAMQRLASTHRIVLKALAAEVLP